VIVAAIVVIEEVAGMSADRVGELANQLDRWIVLSSLDASKVPQIYPGAARQLGLSEASAPP
jgi:hypothetical protein